MMKILAEEQIKAGRFERGIDTAKEALAIQTSFFKGMINFQVQETMLLLAEAFTVNSNADKALNLYKQLLDARSSGFGGAEGDSKRDILRKMAPLFTQL